MWNFGINSVLIEQLANGNDKAFSFLVETYNQRLCAYANGVTNDPDRAQDIVQNVFIKTWEKRKTLRNNSSIKGFLYRAVYNECIDHYRSNRSSMILQRLYLDTVLEFDMDTGADLIEDILPIVMEAVNGLPNKCKEIFLLSKKEGLTNEEIANYLGISNKTVENQMTKSFYLIREKLYQENKF